jgi:predicted Zn-dependent protease
VFIAVFAAGGCAVSEKEELDIGRKSHAQFEKQSGGAYPDQQLQTYVNQVGMSVARYAGRPTLDWQFLVVNSDQINAFAVPGGYIYITQGLLFRLQNESQLAGVLAHESTHIAHRHSVKQIESARAGQGLTIVADVVGAVVGMPIGSATSLVTNLSLMKYGRDQEKDADITGMQFMTQAGYNPQGMVQTMEILEKASGGKGSPEFLSTHPNPGNRVEYLTEEVKKYPDAAAHGNVGVESFQQNVLSRRIILMPAGH